jgi:hypothetical protein
VNIIALSAGTGVAVWACEHLGESARIQSLVLLGSSLASTRDMTPTLAHIDGGIWVYYSPHDMILLGPMRTLGTIDGRIGVEPVGLVGLRPRSGDDPRINNIRWSPQHARYGWSGSHIDGTTESFVRSVLARHVMKQEPLFTDRMQAPPGRAGPAAPEDAAEPELSAPQEAF